MSISSAPSIHSSASDTRAAIHGAGERRRDTQMDCVKGALMILVVLGHLLEGFIVDSPTYRAIYSAIYVFHMPLFVFTTGMFSKALLGIRDYKAIFTRLILPLFFFQCAYVLPHLLRTGELSTPLLQPYWMLWFLLSAVLWKLALPLFASIPFALPLAATLSILAGFNSDIGMAFSLSRTLYFFPFFLTGHLYGKQLVALVARRRVIFQICLFAIVMGMACWSVNGLDQSTLYGSRPYATAAALAQAPAVGRAILLALGLVASLGFVACIPRNAARLAYLGERTMGIYVVHGFLIVAFAKAVLRWRITSSLALLPALVTLAVTIAVVLAPFDGWLNKGFSGVAEWMTRSDVAETAERVS